MPPQIAYSPGLLMNRVKPTSNTRGRGLLNNFFNPKGSTAAEVAQSRYGFTKYPPFYNREGDLKPARGTMYPLAWNMGEDFLPYREWGVTPKLIKDALTVVEAGGGRPITPEQVFEGYMGPAGGALASSLARGAFRGADEGLLGVNVWHGSPHKWKPEPGFSEGRPRLDKVGTGEGATTYGHGFYAAEAPGVAKSYKGKLGFKPNPLDIAEMVYYKKFGDADASIKKLKRDIDNYDYQGWPSMRLKEQYEEALKKLEGWKINPPDKGALYKLDIPDADAAKYLDYDLPRKYQPENIQKALEGIFEKRYAVYPKMRTNPVSQRTSETEANELLKGFGKDSDRYEIRLAPDTGKDIYFQLVKKYGSKEAASEALRKVGIPGLKYFDALSRGKGKGSRNYVTWDQDVLDRIDLL